MSITEGVITFSHSTETKDSECEDEPLEVGDVVVGLFVVYRMLCLNIVSCMTLEMLLKILPFLILMNYWQPKWDQPLQPEMVLSW